MSKRTVLKDSSQMKVCAFCKYWYDPSNSVIAPKHGVRNHWEYETGEVRICSVVGNHNRKSENRCSKFESKI